MTDFRVDDASWKRRFKVHVLFIYFLYLQNFTHTHAHRERESLKNKFYFRNCGSEFVTIQVKCKLTEKDLLPYFSTGRVHVNMALQTPDRIFKRKPSVHQNC